MEIREDIDFGRIITWKHTEDLGRGYIKWEFWALQCFLTLHATLYNCIFIFYGFKWKSGWIFFGISSISFQLLEKNHCCPQIPRVWQSEACRGMSSFLWILTSKAVPPGCHITREGRVFLWSSFSIPSPDESYVVLPFGLRIQWLPERQDNTLLVACTLLGKGRSVRKKFLVFKGEGRWTEAWTMDMKKAMVYFLLWSQRKKCLEFCVDVCSTKIECPPCILHLS